MSLPVREYHYIKIINFLCVHYCVFLCCFLFCGCFYFFVFCCSSYSPSLFHPPVLLPFSFLFVRLFEASNSIYFTFRLLRCRDHSTHNPPLDDERGTRAGGKDGGDQSADGDLGVPAVAEAAVHSRDDEGGGGGYRLAAAAAERCGHLAALREAWSVPLGVSVSWKVLQKADGVGGGGGG